jgi:hypothetical protein
MADKVGFCYPDDYSGSIPDPTQPRVPDPSRYGPLK